MLYRFHLTPLHKLSQSLTIKPIVATDSSFIWRKILKDFTIGELSRLTGVKIETIRYYETIGIMPNPPRNSSGYRVYATPHRERLSFIRRSRELGFSQPEVRKLLTLVDEHQYTCAEVRDMTARQLANVHAKIEDLQKMATALARMVNECAGGDIPECPIIDALLSANG